MMYQTVDMATPIVRISQMFFFSSVFAASGWLVLPACRALLTACCLFTAKSSQKSPQINSRTFISLIYHDMTMEMPTPAHEIASDSIVQLLLVPLKRGRHMLRG